MIVECPYKINQNVEPNERVRVSSFFVKCSYICKQLLSIIKRKIADKRCLVNRKQKKNNRDYKINMRKAC